MGMVQDVTKQHRVERLIRRRKTRSIIATIIDRRFSAIAQVDAQRPCAEHPAEMMGDKTIAAANVQDLRSMRYRARDFQSHVISAADFAPSPFALAPAKDSVYKR